MKIVMLCGSPRAKNSTSAFLLQEVAKRLEGENEIWSCHPRGGDPGIEKEIAGRIAGADRLILAFPLYVDGIPASMLELMRGIDAQLTGGKTECRVFLLVNNGFYEAAQNRIAIDMVWSWCRHCGLQKGYAVSVGAGEMAQMAPLGHGPSKNLGRAVERLASDLLCGATRETVFVEPNFPRALYLLAAHSGWRRRARKNGLRPADLRHKW